MSLSTLNSIALCFLLVTAANRLAVADDPDARAEIIDSIKLGTSDDWPGSATDKLIQRLESSDGRVRWAAAWALSRGPAEIIPRLNALDLESKAPQQRRALTMALSYLVSQDSSALLGLCRMTRPSDAIEAYYFSEGLERVSIEQAGLRRTLLLLPEPMGLRPGDGYRPHGMTAGVGTNGTSGLHRPSWHELMLFKLGPPSVADAPMLKTLLSHKHPVTRRMAEEQIAMLGERAADFSEAAPEEVAAASMAREQRRRKIKELLAHATASSANETRSETIRLQYVRYRAPFILSDVAASVMRDFIFDMRGAAPSRAVAIERLRSSFNDMKEANTVLIGLSNSYRYRQVYRPYISVARRALGLDKQPSQSPEAESLFPQAVLAVLNDPPDKSAFSKLAASGPAGVPFLAAFVGHPERSVHVSVCFKLRSIGALAMEAIPALRRAVDGEHSRFTRMALERISHSAQR